ncbi:uncharacterized protein IAS62_001052 [Cryptococcus decagattii]|uniref:Uncharacterized protein n=1 Tax=Cryptococcus decagattii TaxID=1859122 RepID=A0ABZ2AMT1_9TREE
MVTQQARKACFRLSFTVFRSLITKIDRTLYINVSQVGDISSVDRNNVCRLSNWPNRVDSRTFNTIETFCCR